MIKAYKGYLIKTTLIGEYVISKDGHHISYAPTLFDAEAIICNLIAPDCGHVDAEPRGKGYVDQD